MNHPWHKLKKSVGEDYFACFMKRNVNIALRKPEGLSTARAQRMNRKAAEDYFTLYKNLCTELTIQDKPQLFFFNLDETGFPLNIPPKTVPTEGAREVKWVLLHDALQVVSLFHPL
jgi:hypothetical protein